MLSPAILISLSYVCNAWAAWAGLMDNHHNSRWRAMLGKLAPAQRNVNSELETDWMISIIISTRRLGAFSSIRVSVWLFNMGLMVPFHPWSLLNISQVVNENRLRKMNHQMRQGCVYAFVNLLEQNVYLAKVQKHSLISQVFAFIYWKWAEEFVLCPISISF